MPAYVLAMLLPLTSNAGCMGTLLSSAPLLDLWGSDLQQMRGQLWKHLELPVFDLLGFIRQPTVSIVIFWWEISLFFFSLKGDFFIFYFCRQGLEAAICFSVLWTPFVSHYSGLMFVLAVVASTLFFLQSAVWRLADTRAISITGPSRASLSVLTAAQEH